MDPDQALKEALQALDEARRELASLDPSHGHVTSRDAHESCCGKYVAALDTATERFESLAGWLLRGGFPPIVIEHPRAQGASLFAVGPEWRPA